MRAQFGCDPTAGSKKVSFKFIIGLGVRSLANASRARQFNPLNPPGVGWVPLPQTNMAAVVGRVRSCVVGRARSCTVVRAWSVMCGRAWSCAVGRARSCAVVRAWSVIRGHLLSCVVVRGRSFVVGHSWSCAVGRARSVVRGRAVLPASRPVRQPALPCCPLRGQHCRDTNEGRKERTNERTNNI